MNKVFIHAWKGFTQIAREASFSENGLYFVGGLCHIGRHFCVCHVSVYICFFEDNPWTELLTEHMHLAEKIDVWSEALAHLWLRVFVNGVPGMGPVCFNSSCHYFKMNSCWALSIWKMQAFCDEYIWD